MTQPTAPLLTTARMDLWLPAATDHAALTDLLAPAAVRRSLGNRPTSPLEEFNRLLRNAGSWHLYGYGTFVCRARGQAEVLGICGVFHSWRGFGKGLDDTPEAGWIFAEAAWGQGLAREAATAALNWFDTTHGPRRVACMINADNPASLKIAAHLGFVEYDRHAGAADEAEVVLLERV